MSRDREPREFERNLFHEVYIDETSQSGPRFLAIGGIVLTRSYSQQFERAIADARGTRLPIHRSDGSLREIKWRYCGNGDFDAYKKVVDAFFDFRKHMAPSFLNTCKFHCSVVDTHVPGRSYSVGKKGQAGFNREIYFHSLLMAQSYYRDRLFHFYLDSRTVTPENTPERTRVILNRGIKLKHDKRDHPFRRMRFRDSKGVQALQVSDILLGALMYRLNEHYDKHNATPDKKLLCDYILQAGGVLPHLKRRGLVSKNGGEYTFHIRKHFGVKKGPAALHPDSGIPMSRVPTKGRASGDGNSL
jgi:hypothetical protein